MGNYPSKKLKCKHRKLLKVVNLVAFVFYEKYHFGYEQLTNYTWSTITVLWCRKSKNNEKLSEIWDVVLTTKGTRGRNRRIGDQRWEKSFKMTECELWNLNGNKSKTEKTSENNSNMRMGKKGKEETMKWFFPIFDASVVDSYLSKFKRDI